VVLHALEREPANRYQHASEVKTDIEAPARHATLPTPATGAEDIEVARHQVRGPSISLMVMGAIGPLGWLIAFLIYTLFLYLDSRDRMGGNSWFWAGLDKGYGPFLILFPVNAVVGGFLIAGARKMKRLEAYEFSVISSLMAGLQIATPTFPVSFIIGGWAFWVLRKPEVKAAFALRLRRMPALLPTEEAHPVEQAALAAARQRVKATAAGLMVTAILNWVGIFMTAFLVGGFVVGQMRRSSPPEPPMESYAAVLSGVVILPALPLILAAGVIFYGALKMKRLESRRLALAAAVLALVVPPAYLIGWPSGVWALAVLTAPEVKAAFGRKGTIQSL
jgi:hypothetical protein